MPRLTNTLTTVVSSATTLTTSTLITLTPVVDIREALSGALHINFNATTAAASKKIDIYALFSRDGTTFDSADVTLLTKLGTVNMPNATTAYDTTIVLDGVTLSGNYMKLALFCDAASNYGRCNSLIVSVRKAV